MRRVDKRGQIKLSFGMIFSIILIIIFLAFGFYAIAKFLNLKGYVEAGKFAEAMQNDVDKMWKSSQGSQEVEYSLSSKVEAVCFVDYSYQSKKDIKGIYEKLKQVYDNEQNFFFYPIGSGQGLDAATIRHIDLEKITKEENPFCVKNTENKVKLTIKKNFDDALVVITE